jgi:MFS family permease
MKGFLARLLPYALAFFSSLCIMVLELVASRLVARHVGASLTVWTSVIGIMLGGICLGNVLGGRLADRIEPTRAIGPLYALGAALTLACLWVNEAMGLLAPGLNYLPWDLRTIVVVVLNFLVPGTVLGMIGPVVAKLAVERARKAGSALGVVYFMGAVGSIVGTFIAGFYLIYLAPTSTIVAVVAAALALLAAALYGEMPGAILGLLAATTLGAGAAVASSGWGFPSVRLETFSVNVLILLGNVLAFALGGLAALRLQKDRRAAEEGIELEPGTTGPLSGLTRWLGRARAKVDPAGAWRNAQEREWTAAQGRVDLTDLAILSFVASLAFMALEMVAGRLVTRHLGSSVYGWTSVIGVLLGGLSLGNFLGGKVADRIKRESQASWLFLFASIFTAAILLAESPPSWLIRNPIAHWLRHSEPKMPLFGDKGAALSQAISMQYGWILGWDGHWHQFSMPWWGRVLFWTAVVFLLPSAAMGTVSPVVAKLAVERVRQSKRTGAAIGQVYAWGMVGSIVGTFLAGFLLIDMLGTKGLILALATTLALAATTLGSVWHAAWAGIPLGLCVIAFVPAPWFEKQGLAWGIREEKGDPATEADALAYVDESNYYYIKVSNEPDSDGQKRTLVLDNLIHGYFVLGHPERVDYDYEHIYALVTRRVVEAKAKAEGLTDARRVGLNTLFLGGGSYTFPRYLQHTYPNSGAEVAEIDPAVTRANHVALGLPRDTPTIRTTWGDARQFVVNGQGKKKFDIVFGDAFNDFSVPWHLTTREFNEKIANMLSPKGVYMINIIDIYRSDRQAAEEGLARGRATAIAAAWKRRGMEATTADALALQVADDLGDKKLGVDASALARAVVGPMESAPRDAGLGELTDRAARALASAKAEMQGTTQTVVEDVTKVLGRSKNSRVLEAARKAAKSGGSVEEYTRELAQVAAEAEAALARDPKSLAQAVGDSVDGARRLGGFLGSWVNTARQTFGDNIYVFGTDAKTGSGLRETFVVVASKAPLDLAELGGREDDPRFFSGERLVEPRFYSPEHMKALDLRAHGIVLTDDYAPVENLLAPVAATRGDD